MLDKNVWISAYIFFDGPYEYFLTNSISPFVKKITMEGLLQRFFFIRYMEEGLHVRLRIYASQDKVDTIKSSITDYFFMEKKEVNRGSQVKFVAYEPETNRYGGKLSLNHCEHIFCASSIAVIEAFSGKQSWSYNNVLGLSIRINLAFVHQFGLTKQEAIAFFNSLSYHWAGHAYTLLKKESDLSKDDIMEAFRHKFLIQQDSIAGIINNTWRNIQSKTHFKDEWYNKWLYSLETIYKNFNDEITSSNFETPYNYSPYLIKLKALDAGKWGVYESLIHMNNNRLGILNGDEAYIAYLVSKSLALLN